MASTKPLVIQINWQTSLGGGEIYTRFFTQALLELGYDTKIMVVPQASFWAQLGMSRDALVPITSGQDLLDRLPEQPCIVVSHNALPPDLAHSIARSHSLAGIVHMPFYERSARGLAEYDHLFPVSGYVRDTLLAQGLKQVCTEPLLGIADLQPRSSATGKVVRHSEYTWDKRKVRDRLYSYIFPKLPRRDAEFSRRPGITLGVFSRLTPIKQFPLLFSYLAPVLARFPQLNLEVFGSGGFATVRDIKRALKPIDARVRFWGEQPDPAAVYAQLDWVLSGLPEKEALGLNLIEAQAAGVPVLAVNGPPFTETVVDGKTGFLYTDPREDGGAHFAELMESIVSGRSAHHEPRLAAEHLAKFSFPAFCERVARAMEACQRQASLRGGLSAKC